MALYVDIFKKLNHFQLSVEFEINGERLALLGASGSGKSFTLKCIAGIEIPDQGQIILDGKVLFDSKKKINIRPQQRNVGFLFQSFALFPNMTVYENIRCVVKDVNIKKKEQVLRLLKLFQLEEVSKLLPRQISGGQQQRVALARLIASKPQIFLLDEPFSALDPHLRWGLEQELSVFLKEQNHNTLFVSHESKEAYRICDKIAVMDNGKIVELEKKCSIFNNPKTLQTAKLLGIKNISPIKKLDDYKVIAEYFGLEITITKKVDFKASWIGIPPDRIIVTDKPTGAENTFKGKVIQVIEEVDRKTLLIQNTQPFSDDKIQNILMPICVNVSVLSSIQKDSYVFFCVLPDYCQFYIYRFRDFGDVVNLL